MGAAEWVGYAQPPYTSYPTNTPLTQPATTTASSYGYESNPGMGDHHSNFHIPTGKEKPQLERFKHGRRLVFNRPSHD